MSSWMLVSRVPAQPFRGKPARAAATGIGVGRRGAAALESARDSRNRVPGGLPGANSLDEIEIAGNGILRISDYPDFPLRGYLGRASKNQDRLREVHPARRNGYNVNWGCYGR
jgi:hypothetical protein